MLGCRHGVTREQEGKRLESGEVAGESAEVLFDHAPVMMHGIDRGGKVIQVNRRWSQKLGYKRKEALGRWSIEFLTEESRARAIKDTLPRFWRTGSACSVGYTFVKRDGRTLDLQMDAEAGQSSEWPSYLRLVRDIDERNQWEQTSATIPTLVRLVELQREYEEILFPNTSGEHQDPTAADGASILRQPAPPGDVLMSLLEIGSDISGHLKAESSSTKKR